MTELVINSTAAEGTPGSVGFNRIDLDSCSTTGTPGTVGFNRIDFSSATSVSTGMSIALQVGAAPSQIGTRVYLFTLTGAEDSTTDVEIPMKSFQARLRSGDPTYLQVVIPGMDYATHINARSNGTLKVDVAYLVDGEYVNRNTIIQANLEDIRIDDGPINSTITLTGHKQETYTANSIILTGAIYKNTINGLIRYRLAEPNVYLRPGDSVTIDTDTFNADVISYFVSPQKTTMEVAES